MTPEDAPAAGALIRVILPYHLRNLAGVGAEVSLEVPAPATVRRVLDALEERYPMLRGTIREYGSGERRAFLRFFACEEDLSLEPLLIIGSIAGG
jgi:hypothetical protein